MIGDKKKIHAGRKKKFLEAMQKRVPRAKFCTLEPEAQFNGLDQKLYEKMTASIKEREDKLCDQTLKDYVEDQEINLKQKRTEFEPT